VNFSESVTVTGNPQLLLETGATDRNATYTSGSGTSALTFTYVVQAGDTSADLTYVATNSLALNGGTILDLAGNASTLTLAAPSATGSLGANKAIVVDTSAPTVILARAGPTATSTSITFTVTGNEDIDCSTLSTVNGVDFTFTNISGITSIVQSSATVCTINATSSAVGGGGSTNSTLTASGTFAVTDTVGNAQTSLTGSPQTIAVTVADSVAPVLTSTSATSVGATTATLNFTSDEAGTYFYLVHPATDPPPSAATVVALGSAVAADSGTALASANTAALTGLTQGSNLTAYVVVRDSAGNISLVSPISLSTSVSTSSVPDLATASDTGQSSTDNVTADTTPTFELSSLTSGALVTLTATPATGSPVTCSFTASATTGSCTCCK
jgi:hypothetical protein